MENFISSYFDSSSHHYCIVKHLSVMHKITLEIISNQPDGLHHYHSVTAVRPAT